MMSKNRRDLGRIQTRDNHLDQTICLKGYSGLFVDIRRSDRGSRPNYNHVDG